MSENSLGDGDPPEKSQAQELLMRFLQTADYLVVSQALVYLESRTARLRVSGAANLRDVFDHLTRAAVLDLPIEQVKHHLAEAREHLRRAAVHPYQAVIESRLAELEQLAKWYFVRREVARDVPSEGQFRERKAHAESLLASARDRQGLIADGEIGETIQILRQCLDELDQLRSDITPDHRQIAVRVAIFTVSTIVSVLIGILIGKLL